MALYNCSDILNMEKRFRTHFVNCLSGFKSLNLAATKSTAGITNVAPISSVIHVGATPPLMGMLIRPNTVPRHTLENIIETEYWTLNHVREEFFESAHQCSARYASSESEFTKTGLKEEYTELYPPYIKNSLIKIGLKLAERIDIKSNGTHFIIGKIQEVILDESCIEEDGFINLENAGSLTVSGLDSYHSTKQIGRLPYAKPK